MRNFLFYVRYNLSGLTIYRCTTNDPFHVMGEMMYRSIERIDYINFVEETKEKTDFWESENYEIIDYDLRYLNKYK